MTDAQLQDLILRLLPEGPAGLALTAEDRIRAALTGPEPDPRAARNIALRFVQGALSRKRADGYHRASLIEVQLAGTFLGVGIQIHGWVPDRPPGPWPPGGDQLTAVYARNLIQILEGEPQ